MRKEKRVLERFVMARKNMDIMRRISTGPEKDDLSRVDGIQVLGINDSGQFPTCRKML
jgi:hypothetical protein